MGRQKSVRLLAPKLHEFEFGCSEQLSLLLNGSNKQNIKTHNK